MQTTTAQIPTGKRQKTNVTLTIEHEQTPAGVRVRAVRLHWPERVQPNLIQLNREGQDAARVQASARIASIHAEKTPALVLTRIDHHPPWGKTQAVRIVRHRFDGKTAKEINQQGGVRAETPDANGTQFQETLDVLGMHFQRAKKDLDAKNPGLSAAVEKFLAGG